MNRVNKLRKSSFLLPVLITVFGSACGTKIETKRPQPGLQERRDANAAAQSPYCTSETTADTQGGRFGWEKLPGNILRLEVDGKSSTLCETLAANPAKLTALYVVDENCETCMATIAKVNQNLAADSWKNFIEPLLVTARSKTDVPKSTDLASVFTGIRRSVDPDGSLSRYVAASPSHAVILLANAKGDGVVVDAESITSEDIIDLAATLGIDLPASSSPQNSDGISGIPAGKDDTTSGSDSTTLPPIVPEEPEPTPFRWKAVLMTGDDSINAFDNARETVKGLFVDAGIDEGDIRELSRRASEQTGGVRASSATELEAAFGSLNLGPDEGCILHLTSHGSRTGFYLRGQPTLTPTMLAGILDRTCGTRPTLVLVSACYSGVFINEPSMTLPQRIILTAARSDRTSFGCGAENEYTYWDGCLIDSLPNTTDFRTLSDRVVSCIEMKESGGGFSQSLPQAYFGTNVTTLGWDGPTP